MSAKKHHLKLGSAIITTVVGRDAAQQTFAVHEALITSRSLFFRNAMQGDWKEAQDRNVNLVEDDPEVFSLYLQCLYAGHAEPAEQMGAEKSYALRGGLYVLAERIRDVQTKNLVIEEIKTKTDVRNHLAAYLKMAAHIYSNTPGPCGLRDLLVDLLVKSHSPQTANEGAEAFMTKIEGMPLEFLKNLVFGLYTKRAIWNKFELREDYGEKVGEATTKQSAEVKTGVAAQASSGSFGSTWRTNS